ncbi:MAG: hypothetical protein WC756_08680 [Taibaiella sp.]|jgi:hypothetical protein
MLTSEENFLRMARTVNVVLNDNVSSWGHVGRFAQGAKDLDQLLSQSAIVSSEAKIVTTGATEDKHEAANKAIELGVKLAKRASIYALDKKNVTLHDQLRISRSSLTNRHDEEAIAKLRDVYKQMAKKVTELGPYMVTQEDLAQLNTLTLEFEAIANKPRVLVTTRKAHNDSVPKLIAEIRTILYDLDSLINIFENTTFASQYANARKIIDLGGRHDDPGGETPPTES